MPVDINIDQPGSAAQPVDAGVWHAEPFQPQAPCQPIAEGVPTECLGLPPSGPTASPLLLPEQGSGSGQMPVCCFQLVPPLSPIDYDYEKAQCNLGVALLPKPGSLQWCQLQADIVKYATAIGTQILTKGIENLANWFTDYGQAIGPFGSVLNLLNRFATMAPTFLEGLFVLLKEIGGAITSCDLATHLGLVILRAGITWAQKIRVGTDALLWLTADFDIDLSELERTLDYLIESSCPTEVPQASEAIRCWMMGSIDERTFKCWMAMRGCHYDIWAPVVQADRRKPEVEELLRLRNRGAIDQQQYACKMRENGVLRYEDFALFDEFRKELPAPSDLVRFAVRHVFEPDIISHFGYDSEFRPAFAYWHERLGFWYDARTPEEVAAGREPFTWAQAQWWSHWILPSPTQGYEMFFRLDPGRDKSGEPDWMQSQDFTQDDLRLLLRANDYPPFWRDKLAAIAQRLPGLRQMTQLVRAKQWDVVKVYWNYRAMGYTDTNAKSLAVALIEQAGADKRDPLVTKQIKLVEDAYRIGTIDEDQFTTALEALGADINEIVQRKFIINVGINSRDAKTMISNLKIRYLDGEIDDAFASNFMDDIGIVPNRRDDYLKAWREEKKAPRKTIAASQAIKYACEGLIPVSEAITRLGHLGFSPNDINVLLADIELCQSNKAAKALQQQLQQGEKAQRAIQAAIKQAQAAHKAALAALERHGSPAMLERWLTECIIGEQEVRDRLTILDWPVEDIDNLIREAYLKQKGKGCPKNGSQGKAGGGGSSGGGQSGGSPGG